MTFKLTHKLLAVNVLSIAFLTFIFLLLSHRANESMLSRAMNGVDDKVMSKLARTLGKNHAATEGFRVYIQDPKLWRQVVDQHFFEVFFSLAQPPSDEFGQGEYAHFEPPETACEPPFAPFFDRLALLGRNKEVLIPATVSAPEVHYRAIKADGKTVGWLKVGKINVDVIPLAEHFFNQQLRISTWASILGGFVALLLSYLLSRHIISPIRRLTHAAELIADRNFNFKVNVNTGDELKTLGNSFNAISREVVRHEKLQKQWLMDISHELRTPLTILIGEVCAMRDGIASCNADALDSLEEEISQIKRLVDDLYELSVIDKQGFSLAREKIDLGHLVSQQVKIYREKLNQRNICLELNAPENPLWVWADGDRLTQVIRNTLENCCRYTESAGNVVVSLTHRQDKVTVQVSDSGPGVSPDAIPKLFDRLYRTDESRSEQRGGSGVGLTICKMIVEAHGGEVMANHSVVGGLEITFVLPMASAWSRA